MYQNLYRTCRVIVLLIKPFVLRRSHQQSPSCLLTQSQTVTICLKKIRKEMKSTPRKAVARPASPWEAIWLSRKTGKCLRFLKSIFMLTALKPTPRWKYPKKDLSTQERGPRIQWRKKYLHISPQVVNWNKHRQFRLRAQTYCGSI